MMKARTRIRPMSCEDCGYHQWGTRSWWERGLPTCPCGGRIVPTKPADLAYCGLVGQHDMPAVQWTAICRENGWEDAIVRRGAAAKAYDRRQLETGGIMGRRAGAAHCAYPGCGRWVADGAERCTAGHAQHEHAEPVEAMPF